MADAITIPRLSAGQRTALSGAAVLAVALAAYGAAGSYETVTTIAARVGVPLPALVPIGIDGGFVGVVVLDLVLAWTGNAVGWLRQFARLLTAGTVAANVSAGWPHPLAIGLHAAAPMMLLVMVEAARTVLLRRIGIAKGTARDRIPIGRWILSPWRTWLLWRRMVLWQITSYRDAIAMEARVRQAHVQLRIHFGRRWKRTAPADLLWMLNTAPFADQAFEAVNKLTDKALDGSEFRTDGPPPSAPLDQDPSECQLDEAIRVNERHWAEHGRPASSETVRKQLGIGATRARELTWAIRAMNKAAVGGQVQEIHQYHM